MPTVYTNIIQFSLAKRAIVATQTIVVDGRTQVAVIDAVEATTTDLSIVTETTTTTETDASFICKYLNNK